MKYAAILVLLVTLSCKKSSTPPASTVIIDCLEKGIHPFFVNSAVTKYTLVTYENNNSFDKVVSVEERYTNENSIENGKYRDLSSKYDYDVRVDGYDTFRISAFVNTPTRETVPQSHHGLHNNCFYNNDFVIVNGDSLIPQVGQYYGKLIIDRK